MSPWNCSLLEKRSEGFRFVPAKKSDKISVQSSFKRQRRSQSKILNSLTLYRGMFDYPWPSAKDRNSQIL